MPAYAESTTRPGRGGWWLVLALLLTVGAFAPGAAPAAVPERPMPSSTTAPDPPRVPDLWMPIAGAVVRGFDARAGPYGPGHRGIDIAAPVGELVRTPAAGRVVFAGPLAGTTWVSLRIAPGVLVTLGPLLDPAVTAGPVGSRSPIGPGRPGSWGCSGGSRRPGRQGGLGRPGRAGGLGDPAPGRAGGRGVCRSPAISARPAKGALGSTAVTWRSSDA
jgi:hypothetical protein